jgi:hypothetical protein
MGRYFLIVFMPLILAVGGCGQDPIKVTGTQTVEVPVPVRCKVVTATRPELVFQTQAKVTDTQFQKTQLLAAEDEALQAYSDQLVAALNVCATAPIPTPFPAAASAAKATK